MTFTPDFTPRTFGAGDYVVFALLLAISTGIGFFYAYKDRNRQNTEEFLLGGRSLSPYPVALSLSVSYMSAVLVLGTPADIYVFGTMYIWTVIAFLIGSIVTAEIYIPVFYNLGLKTVYEYLEHRFHRVVRISVTVIFVVHTTIYMGIVIYAPALALNVVTGFNIWGGVVATGAICVVYSTLGGIKAVIWTDSVQMIVMLIGFVSVIIQGSIKAGGIGTLWRNCEEGNRIEFWNFNLDPRIRYTVWSVVVGGGVTATSLYAVNQNQVQRYLSCRTLSAAKMSVMINWVGLFLLNALAVLVGIVVYGYYHGCDPLQYAGTGLTNRDQLLPYIVLDFFQNNPGMPGLILASIYSGSLSTVSTGITALASVTISDFFKPWFDWSEKIYTWVARGLVVLYGIISMIFAYLTSQFGGLLHTAISIHGVLGGPVLGIFTLGILFPCANTIGALTGLAVGLAVNIWIFVAGLNYRFYSFQFQGFRRSLTDNCPETTTALSNMTITTVNSINSTTIAMSPAMMPNIPPEVQIYSMSFWYVTVWGCTFTVVVGLLVSFLTSGYRNRKNVDPRYVHPFFSHWIFFCLPKSVQKFTWCGLSHDMKEMENKVEIGGIENPDFNEEKV